MTRIEQLELELVRLQERAETDHSINIIDDIRQTIQAIDEVWIKENKK